MFQYFVCLMLLFATSIFSQEIVLNEIMASNQTTIADEDGDFPDWIELYNNSGSQINLVGYGLSDDSLDLQKWTIENAIIEPGEYLLVFASDKDRQTTNLHTNFKVSASGEKILLSDTSGSIIDQIFVPASNRDISYGRKSDGSLPWIFQLATPYSNNTGQEFMGFADSVFASVPSGFYSGTFSVELSAGESQIFYTLDGNDPDTNSTVYSTAISIDNTSVLKAKAYRENYLPGPMLVKSYFINESTDLPVISLVSDSNGLFNFDYGIYADGPGWTEPDPHYGANFWMDWEREATIEFFEDDKQFGFSENAIIAIFGAWSRAHPQKSFSVKFKSDFGKQELHYPLFPGFDVTTFKSFLLRNSGNDFWNTHVRDAVMQAIVKDLDIDYLEYRPAVTFINGKYWGIYNIREKISEHYVANRHNVDPDNIDMLENNGDVIHGDSVHYNTFIKYISENNMTTDSSYNFVNKMIDMDNCLLYYAFQMYINNRDWPGNNIKYWRERSKNGKWRWIVYDTDFGFNLYGDEQHNDNPLTFALSYTPGQGWPNPNWSTLIMRKLLENPDIKNKFINLFADLLNTNFQTSKVVSIINDYVNHIANEISKHRGRFGVGGENTGRMIEFAEKRPGNMRNFIRDYFNAGNNRNLTVNSTEGGKVIINSLSFNPSDLPWSGIYFQNIPITAKAVANNGYKFDGWSGTITSQIVNLQLFVTSNTDLFASFSVDSSAAKDIVINEINYSSSELFDTGDWIELYNRSNENINLSEWTFTDSGTDNLFTIPFGTILEADQYLVLVENDSAFTSHFPEVDNYVGELDFGLRSTGEFIKLESEEGQLIDSLTYKDELPWPTEANGSGATLELLDPDIDNANAENWRASTGHGSPGRLNSVLVSVKQNKGERIPEKFLVFQNYPNPFNSATKIRFHLNRNYKVSIKVFDVNGKIIHKTLNKNYNAGAYSYSIKFTENLASGVYFYQILLDGVAASTKKMILIR